ncbi:MAG: hypothetical protein ACPG6X_08105 [Synechococcus sp.]
MLDRTRWTPLARNGHAWRTHRLEVHAADDWAELRPTLPNQRPLLLISAGTGLTLMLWLLAQDTASSGGALMPFLGWLTILLIAMPIFALTLRTVVFDRRSDRFWEQRTAWSGRSSSTLNGRLRGIHAIQLLPEKVLREGAFAPQGLANLRHQWFFTSYELNLVNHHGGRLNLIDHADLSALRRDGERLAQFLEVPFWDGVHREGDSMTDLKMEVLRRLTL